MIETILQVLAGAALVPVTAFSVMAYTFAAPTLSDERWYDDLSLIRKGIVLGWLTLVGSWIWWIV